MPKQVKGKTDLASRSAAALVTEQLRAYATRGVFREFTVKELPGGVVEYRFVYLTPKAVRARFDAKSSLLTLIDLLPDIKPRATMDQALRAFITGRFSAKLPEHRRIARRWISKVVCVNRNRRVSLRLTLNKRDSAPGTRQALLLVSEIFQNFLAGPYHEYMVRNFDLRED
jgi:hypothetical protein